ncbi:hypothetical protein HK107_09525 [Parvularcula sp. ZS-1/3]|uniref:BRCT domain-containing protein n=1 Tax=Parvularcula mediterranea TaxID=2732508 RepID=A0A7Y3RM09_9PROT|nr:hypothetical protein [Parvularcula mediterranea]NNU16559.1 hypothetical protein [Parvularcula mediterranea]
MSLNDKALHTIHAQQNEAKNRVFWFGFMEGVASSNGIEVGERAALLAEAEALLKRCSDQDASELIAEHDCSDDELLQNLRLFIESEQRRFYTLNTSDEEELTRFLGFLAGVNCDDTITSVEQAAIRKRWQSSNSLSAQEILTPLADSLLPSTSDERSSAARLQSAITAIVGDAYANTGIPALEHVHLPPGSISDPAQLQIEDRIFVLTGKFWCSPRSRKTIEKALEDLGATCKNHVAFNTDYLVVGNAGSEHYRTPSAGGKILSALSYQKQGSSISFVNEHAIATALRIDS